MNVVCVIPARGGSKGLPNKNLKPLLDKPLIAHSIIHALESQSVSSVYVSSDCDDILSVSASFGAQVIKRPDEYATDFASSESALAHTLTVLGDRSEIPDYVVFLQCTSPIRRKIDIDEAINKIVREGGDSLLSVISSHTFLWTQTDTSAASINYDYVNRPRRQDMPAQYQENGSIYIFKPSILKKKGNRLGGKICMHVMEDSSRIDIDSAFDFFLAEQFLKHHKCDN
jgi:N-acylneuraminate cytidylyltransferase